MNYELRKTEPEKIHSFTTLIAWQEGHTLVLMTYRVTRLFPKEELFGLVMQMRRCAVSVTSNIAEGFSRATYGEKVQFYSMALGSLTELQNQSIVAHDVGFMTSEAFEQFGQQSLMTHKLLNGLIKSSKRRRDAEA